MCSKGASDPFITLHSKSCMYFCPGDNKMRKMDVKYSALKHYLQLADVQDL